jgi:hypothetical protein
MKRLGRVLTPFEEVPDHGDEIWCMEGGFLVVDQADQVHIWKKRFSTVSSIVYTKARSDVTRKKLVDFRKFPHRLRKALERGLCPPSRRDGLPLIFPVIKDLPTAAKSPAFGLPPTRKARTS